MACVWDQRTTSWVSSLFPPLFRFQGSNSCLQACPASTFPCWTISLAPDHNTSFFSLFSKSKTQQRGLQNRLAGLGAATVLHSKEWLMESVENPQIKSTWRCAQDNQLKPEPEGCVSSLLVICSKCQMGKEEWGPTCSSGTESLRDTPVAATPTLCYVYWLEGVGVSSFLSLFLLVCHIVCVRKDKGRLR